MSEILRSVGLDVGTTSTQLIFSRLAVENRASGFSVPELEIVRREVVYKSPVHFTPLLEEDRVDAAALRTLVEAEYRRANVRREEVDTGAIIITGETSRRENARAVLEAMADLAGDFVVAAAGPELESILAARGAGAPQRSEELGSDVVHVDIGGGTANFALIREGKILRTTCLNVGGRLIKFEKTGIITYVSGVLQGICALKVGDRASPEALEPVAEVLTRVLEMGAGLRPATDLLARLTSAEAGAPWAPPEPGAVISFSGGVADCLSGQQPWDAFGDLGPILGRAIARSTLCAGRYLLGKETIRATVIGAGCHSAQLSGSTVFHRNIPFPLKNLPVVLPESMTPEGIRKALETRDETPVLAFPGISSPEYRQIRQLAEVILEGTGENPVLICLEADMARALGQALALRSDPRRQILCMDRLRVREGSFLDIGAPIGPALPVVVKTLILSR